MPDYFNKFEYAKKLRDAGASHTHASALADALSGALEDPAISARDLKLLEINLIREISPRLSRIESDLEVLKFLAFVIFVLELLIALARH